MNDVSVGVNAEKTNVTHDEYGKAGMMGLELQFSKILGDVVIENYMKQISDEDMKMLIHYMQSDLFEEYRDFSASNTKEPVIKKRIKDNWVEEKIHGFGRTEHTSVGNAIKQAFNTRVKEDLQKKMLEIVKTKDYQDKIDAMADEIVEYITEGYKEDLKQSIREKMIGNIMNNNDQFYGGDSLIQVIRNVIQSYIPNNQIY